MTIITWLMVFAIVLSIIIILEGTNILLRKAFNVDKVKTGFLKPYKINDQHIKINLIVRFGGGFLALITFFYVSSQQPNPPFYILIAVIVFWSVLEYLVNAFFEWKYSSTPRRAFVSLGNSFVLTMGVVIVIYFDLLGLLELYLNT
ncbi:membrane-associated HD superfamily phosphohydrolase [Alkalibacillus filiformis]|uniref:Membrane-associated HD superfamily phosphohydrolase n=1 Tax=Alkalibacillus filiformis TaxID=200990 RepID=A0ABU0DTY6_9BACI|nr:DUF4181 domain-containing protein [Alkalibacillus filiformis]MDQ0351918.1 membrane-associated HD superfamily phosphohydrolase [Alkalibacillus filiformis]